MVSVPTTKYNAIGRLPTFALVKSSMQHAAYEPLYLAGIELFNACEFFESHEVWEELWSEERGPSRKFYQGLIQAAVALHHFGNGNIRGARKLFHSSQQYLEPYRPTYLGLDLEKFLADMQRCFAPVLATQDEFPNVAIDAETIPEIHLEP
jgi:hypothetical protein